MVLLANRRRIEATIALDATEQFQIFAAIADGITVQDPSGRLVYANDAAARLIGFSSPQELLATPLGQVMSRFETFDERGEPLAMEELPGRKVLEGHQCPDRVVRFRIIESGEDRWSRVDARPVFDQVGPVKFAVNIFHDITEQMNARRELEARAERIEFQAGLLDEVESAVIATDLTGHVTFWNKHAERLYGWSSAEAVGRNIKELTVGVDDGAQAQEIIDAVSEGRRWSGELRATREDGSSVSVQITNSPIHDSQGNLVGVVGISTDITKRKRAEEERSILLASEQLARIEAEAAAESLRAIQSVTDAALGHLGLDDLLDELVTRVGESSRSDVAALLSVDEGTQELVVRAATGFPVRAAAGQRIPRGRGVAGRIATSSRPLAVEDLEPDELGVPGLSERISSVAGVPLCLKDRLLGVLLVGSKEARRFTRPDVRLLELVGDRIVYAIEHARLFEAEKRARRTAEQAVERVLTLQTLTAALSEAVTRTEVASAIIDQGLFALGADSGSVALVDEKGEQLEVVAAEGYEPRILERYARFPIDAELPIAETVRTGKLVLIEAPADRGLLYPRLPSPGRELNAFAAIPLLLEGETLGGLGLSFANPQRFSEDDRTFMSLLAQQCAQALERARLYEAEARARAEEQLARERLQFLARGSEALAGSLDYRDTLSYVVNLAISSFADSCVIDLPGDPHVDGEAVIAHADPDKIELIRRLRRRFPADPGDPLGVDSVLRTGRSELHAKVPDSMLEMMSRDEAHLAMLEALGLRSQMIVPLSARGRILGAITFSSSRGDRTYDEDDLELAEDLARRAATAIDNARLFHQLEEQEDRLRQLVQSLDAIVWEADLETLEYRFVSRRAEAIFGYPVERWLEQPDFWIQLIHEEDRARVVAERRTATAAGRDHEVDFRAVAADGRMVWLRDIVHVHPGEEGRPGWLRGVSVDITETKVAQQALHYSRERFAYLARTLQRSLLPPRLPEIPGVEIGFRYEPAATGNQVGGDFYDLFEWGDGWGVVVGDVQGKGPRAAALTGLVRHTIRALTLRERDPVTILQMLNDAVLREVGEGRSAQFCTVVYGRLSMTAGAFRLSLASGGHPQPLLLRSDGTLERVGPPGMLLGAFARAEVAQETIELGSGDAVVFFTDGVTESRRGTEVFGEARLESVVRRCRGRRAEKIAEAVEQAATAFGSGGIQDDIALLVLRVTPEHRGGS